MQSSNFRLIAILLVALAAPAVRADDEVEEKVEVIVSIAEQKLMVLRDGMWTHRFPVSTSKFGLGDSFGSYKTPLGKLRVCEKVGAGLPPGSVMVHRNPTGEILPVNARGRDPIVTRIIWLEGLEPGNGNARRRGIYIHGTVEESKIGQPVSYGCIRMKSRDVLDLFEAVPMGSIVNIQQEKLPRAKRWSAPPKPKPLMIAAKEPVKTREPAPIAQRIEMPPRTEPTPMKQKEPVVIAQHKPARVEVEPVRPPSAAARLVINASGTVDHDVRPSSFAADAFKGSILFADLPGQEPRPKN